MHHPHIVGGGVRWLPARKLPMGLNEREMNKELACSNGILFNPGCVQKAAAGQNPQSSKFWKHLKHRDAGTYFQDNLMLVRIFCDKLLRNSGVASEYSRYSVNTLQFPEKTICVMLR